MVLHAYHTFRTWAFEIFSTTFAVGLIAAIWGLLLKHDGKPPPNFGERFNLNLNALLALLSTILRATLVILVSSIICQRMWEWFANSRARPLSDFQRFDAGSRGILGALQLSTTTLATDAITLMAISVMISSFLVGPFVQQASRTVPCRFPVLGSNASLPFAHFVPRKGGFERYLGSDGDPGRPLPDTFLAVLSTALVPEGVENRVTATCSTGDCTFPGGDPRRELKESLSDADSTTHSTVGVCSACSDVSALIYVTGPTQDSYENYTLPNGYSLGRNSKSGESIWIKPTLDLTWMGDIFTPSLRASSRWAYANATLMVKLNNTAMAAVCVVYPCVRTYTSSIIGGKLVEELLESEPMQIDVTGAPPGVINAKIGTENSQILVHYDHVAIKSPCRAQGHVYDQFQDTTGHPEATKIEIADFSVYPYTIRNITAPGQCIYRQDAQFVGAISNVLHEGLFNATCYSWRSLSCMTPGTNTVDPDFSNVGLTTFLDRLHQVRATNISHIADWFDSFSTALTNRFRFEYGAGKLENSTNGRIGENRAPGTILPLGEVQGLVWETVTCVSMQWEWLLLPGGLTLVTIILTLWTIFRSWQHRHKVPVWKDSILPFIFYGHKIESLKHGALENLRANSDLSSFHIASHDGASDEPSKLMEASEMDRIGRGIPIKFRLPGQVSADEAVTSISTSVRKRRLWSRRHAEQEQESEVELMSTTPQLRNSGNETNNGAATPQTQEVGNETTNDASVPQTPDSGNGTSNDTSTVEIRRST